jgi:hypothetical protein
MVCVLYDTVGVAVGHDEGGSFRSSYSVFVCSGYSCKRFERFKRAYGFDIVFVGRTLFDRSQSLCILGDKTYGGIGLGEKNFVF